MALLRGGHGVVRIGDLTLRHLPFADGQRHLVPAVVQPAMSRSRFSLRAGELLCEPIHLGLPRPPCRIGPRRAAVDLEHLLGLVRRVILHRLAGALDLLIRGRRGGFERGNLRLRIRDSRLRGAHPALRRDHGLLLRLQLRSSDW